MLPVSILDLAPITSATTGAQALHNSLDLARLADRLGYRRYWVAEHHNLASVASSSPDIIIARIAAATAHLRVGSGGVMLPNHAPLVVAERFKTLEALFPGRIDLGIGRAPGTDPVTAYALRRRQSNQPEDDFVERLQELILFGSDGFPETHPFAAIRAMPTGAALPPLWLLGSSDQSAMLAAALGVGFAFAHHFATYDAVAVMRDYRDRFRPSVWRERPYAILAVAAIAADGEDEAESLAATVDLNVVRRSRGEYLPLASPEEARATPFTEEERERIRRSRSRLFVGTKEMVRERLAPLLDATRADEVMVTTMIYDHAARRRSYELLAEVYGLSAPSDVPSGSPDELSRP